MSMTMSEKILAKHAGKDRVSPGEVIICNLSLVMANDVTAPPAIERFRELRDEVFDPDRVVFVADHFTPSKDIASAENVKILTEFSKEQGLTKYRPEGSDDFGIEHIILPENGWVLPGDLVIGGDSHTCTYGALQAFATGVGSTDIAAAMATGKAWFRVPESFAVRLEGELSDGVTGKDVVLYLLSKIGVDGARYQALEFMGPGVASLKMSDRLTISNMAIEGGAKAGLFPFDATLEAYIAKHAPERYQSGDYMAVESDPDASYAQEITINLSELKPMVAAPHLPENAFPVDEMTDSPEIQQVVIGSCTNGRLEDLRAAAKVLEGHHVAEGVRLLILPGSQRIWRQAMEEGLLSIFLAAGATIGPPTCGPCLGGHMGVLAAGERCVSTTNRNFIGRMGHKDSEIYLASPATAAYSAISGKVAGATIGVEA